MIDVELELEALRRMTTGELREKYGEVFREQTRSYNKQHLVKRIIWKIQANEMGGLSERALARARELARDADFRLSAPKSATTEPGPVLTTPFHASTDARLPMPGTLIRRKYKDRTIVVRVLPNGFEFEGEVYRSLTAIAEKVTGSHWNGMLFFNLVNKKRDKEVVES